MKLRAPACILILAVFFSTPCFAGIFELSASTSFRRSTITEDNRQEMNSYTGSISYYFLEMSAIELSYTQGESTLYTLESDTTTRIKYVTEFEMLGADLVITLAGKNSPIKPYVKAGIARITKKVRLETDVGSSEQGGEPEEVPSAGLGIKIGITKTLSFKAGADVWFTETSDGRKEDLAGRAGLSWLF